MPPPGTPSVSVIIPVFNRPAAVCRAIKSVLAQTFHDFEIIVVDDCSTDATSSEVAGIGDSRIILLRHERRRGGSAARNSGIQASRAQYVAFLDSDDEWLPSKLHRQLELFEESPDELGLVYAGVERILANGTVTSYTPKKYENLPCRLLTDNVVGGASVAMVRREVLDSVGGFDEALLSGQDVDLWLRICERFSADFIAETLVRVWESDADRITVDVTALIRGRDVFFEKHREKLIRERVLHLWLRQVAWIHHRCAGDLRTARRLYLRAIVARPTAALTYMLLLLACIPSSWMRSLVRFKNRLAQLVGADPEAWYFDEGFQRVTMAPLKHKRRGDLTRS
jgi:glycosyltransferase involved in cell wall biosynthesis